MVNIKVGALSLLALPVASGFSLGNLLLTSLKIRLGGIEVVDDVTLPPSMGTIARIKNLLDLQIGTNKGVIQYGVRVSGLVDKLLGKSKSDGLDYGDPDMIAVQSALVYYAVQGGSKTVPDPVPGYLYWGNNDFTKILPLLCQNNPFFANGLSTSDDGQHYELKAYSPTGRASTDPRFLKFMRQMDRAGKEYHRINVKFTKDFEIDEIVSFDKDGKPTVQPRSEWNFYASGAAYNLLYFASSIHATIHVLHYISTCGIKQATKFDKKLTAWCDPYNDNIPIKYAEVSALLIASNIVDSEKQAITGADGFGASKANKPLLKEALTDWGQCKTAEDFMDTFLLKDLSDKLKDNRKFLPEFKKHIKLVTPYAKKLRRAMQVENRQALATAEDKLTKFMKGSNAEVFDIDGIIPWVSIMSCTGIMHGSTLSYTRLFGIPEVMRWRNLNSDVWDNDDVNLISTGLGTVSGMTIDRHVFTSEINYGKKWNQDKIPKMGKEINSILEEFDRKAIDLREDYKDEVLKRDDVREFGWILTDYCPDGFDGKQHTIATYI